MDSFVIITIHFSDHRNVPEVAEARKQQGAYADVMVGYSIVKHYLFLILVPGKGRISEKRTLALWKS